MSTRSNDYKTMGAVVSTSSGEVVDPGGRQLPGWETAVARQAKTAGPSEPTKLGNRLGFNRSATRVPGLPAFIGRPGDVATSLRQAGLPPLSRGPTTVPNTFLESDKCERERGDMDLGRASGSLYE